MSKRLRIAVLGVATVLVLAFANLQIAGKEAVIRDGRTVLMRLAPVDPRSLMQGDYMALRYAMTEDIAAAARTADVSDGIAIVRLDEAGEASFVALFGNQQIDPDQALIRFRKRGESVRIASDAYFFEEGQFETYRNARFGELRVNRQGDAVLTGLRGDDGQRLGTSLHRFD